MHHSNVNVVATTAGVLIMMYALVCSCVPSTNGDYRTLLRDALAAAGAAVACLAVPVVRGPLPWRMGAGLLASPALFVVADFCLQAPSAFGRR